MSQGQAYIFYGILTTAVNFIVYMFFAKLLQLDYKIAATLAWVAAIVFAFGVNKFFVFKSKTVDRSVLLKEIVSFLVFRSMSYFIDIVAIIVLIEWMGIIDGLAKLLASAIVALVNYITSKHVVFRAR